MTDSIQNILDSIRSIVRALRLSSSQSERQLGISAAQLFVLQKLNEHGPLSLNEVAEKTLTHQSSVSVVVQKLIKRALVSKRRSATDARRLELNLTPQGKRMLVHAPLSVPSQLIGSLELLKPHERETLALLLGRTVKQANISTGAAPLFFEDAPAKKVNSKKQKKGNES